MGNSYTKSIGPCSFGNLQRGGAIGPAFNSFKSSVTKDPRQPNTESGWEVTCDIFLLLFLSLVLSLFFFLPFCFYSFSSYPLFLLLYRVSFFSHSLPTLFYIQCTPSCFKFTLLRFHFHFTCRSSYSPFLFESISLRNAYQSPPEAAVRPPT